MRNIFKEHHQERIHPVIFPEHKSVHFANLAADVDMFRGQGSKVIEAADRLLRRDKSCSSRVCRKGNFILMHALEALSNRRDVDH